MGISMEWEIAEWGGRGGDEDTMLEERLCCEGGRDLD